MINPYKATLAATCILVLAASTAFAEPLIKAGYEFKKPSMIKIDGDISLDNGGAALPSSGGYSAPGVKLGLSFEGVSQYDGALFARNFIPPDTMGAVGKTQYMETTNGAYAVFDKATGTRTSIVSDLAFWASAGQTGANGDSRVMYNAAAQRWIAISFGGNAKDIQIAVSDTSDALGGWKSTKFEGYGGFGFGATADYPTLAMDGNAVYIGTNNFAPATLGGTNSFRGTTLNVIPVDGLFGVGVPSTANMKQFTTPYVNGGSNLDRGYAIQGVNSSSASTSGTVVSASLFYADTLGYKINGLTSGSATLATLGGVTYSYADAYDPNGPGRQPAAIAANQRIVDTSDDRISSSVYEVNGRIYGVHVVTPTGTNETRVRYFVLDATTLALLDEGDIGEAGYDYYQGSIAVNSQGNVVIAYNRSGYDALTGKISIMARTFTTAANGKLVQFGNEVLIKESLTDDYHNGSIFGQTAAGRQRWGDYSAVSVDPEDESNFWLIGEFAREYNNAEGGHVGGSGGSRWGTFISMLDFDPLTNTVPEPPTWALMLLAMGFGVYTLRKRAMGASI